MNGASVGGMVPLMNGLATLTTTINGTVGSNDLTAFYQGDSTYAESVSAAVPVTISTFALSSPGTTTAIGSAAIAPVTVNVANGYTTPINLTCTLPADLAESACFIDPHSMTGTGKVSLTVNTTPAHPLSSELRARPGWFAASGGASLACLFVLVLPRRRWRGKAMLLLAMLAAAFTTIGCGGTAKTDPGTAPGSYMVVVTATAGS